VVWEGETAVSKMSSEHNRGRNKRLATARGHRARVQVAVRTTGGEHARSAGLDHLMKACPLSRQCASCHVELYNLPSIFCWGVRSLFWVFAVGSRAGLAVDMVVEWIEKVCGSFEGDKE
jgi:hypothetical protein